MGGKCSKSKASPLETPDSANTALLLIREAQEKYFNSHIESCVESDEEHFEDSTDDMYESESSLNLLDDDSVDNVTMDSFSIDNVDLDGNGQIQGSIATGLENVNLQNNGGGDGQENSKVLVAEAGDNVDSHKKSKASKSSKKGAVKKREKAKYIRLSKRGDFFSIFNTEDKLARSVNPNLYQYPFENLVFEGGGNKGLAYCGCVRLLEELNIWPQIKRLSGSSAGAMTAALLAVGYNSHDLEQFFSLNLNDIFLDHKFGYLSLLPNLLKSYGWNPGNKIYKWFGQKMKDKTNNADITFKQVYEMFGRELCVVATNLNQMTSLYCHPKTTPEMPVRLAVRMSLSIPGMFQAVTHTMYGQTDVFVDGGVLCNYPVHCFDGWWLSMNPEDNFLEKLQPLEDIPRLLERTERFGVYNEKTLGFQLYADNEQDLLKYQLENLRHGVQLQELPNTKLAREKIKKKQLQTKTDREHRRLVKAMNSFLRALSKHNADKNETIDREELEAALKDETFFPKHRRLMLFGDVTSDVILEYMDRDQNGQISYNELVNFMEETGISMQNRFLGYQRRTIKSFPSFLNTLQATLLTNVKRVYVEERDLKRTVGINTGHVGTSDFVLENADVEFVLERGRRSLEAFLKYYVATHNLKKRPEFRKLNIEGRKGSKASVLSNQSVDSSMDSTRDLLAPSTSVADVMLTPNTALSEGSDSLLTVSGIENGKTVESRTKSTSSGKSVRITNNVEYIYNDYAAGVSSSFKKEDKVQDGEEVTDSKLDQLDDLHIEYDYDVSDTDDADLETLALLAAEQMPSKRPVSLPNNASQTSTMLIKCSPQTPNSDSHKHVVSERV